MQLRNSVMGSRETLGSVGVWLSLALLILRRDGRLSGSRNLCQGEHTILAMDLIVRRRTSCGSPYVALSQSSKHAELSAPHAPHVTLFSLFLTKLGSWIRKVKAIDILDRTAAIFSLPSDWRSSPYRSHSSWRVPYNGQGSAQTSERDN